MTSFQRIIRDLANAFAILLIVGIFTGTAGLLFVITGGASIKNYIVEQRENVEFSEKYDGVEEIKIELASSNLIILSGDELKVETNDSSISSKLKKNTLKIEENGKLLSLFDDTTVIIYLPEGKVFEKIDIETGTGSVSIDKLLSKKLDFDVGAGETTVKYIQVLNSADIDLGTGSFNIDDSDFNNLKLDVGVGKSNVKGDFTGRNEFDVGIGEFILNVNSSIDNYTVEAETGIGEFIIGDDVITGECIIGSGENKLEVSGGIGKVSIDFAQ